MLRLRSLIWVGVVFAIAAAVTLLGGRTARAPGLTPAPVSSAGAGGPGEQHRWSLAFNAGFGRPEAKTPMTVHVKGEWVTTLSAIREAELDVACELVNARVSGDGFRDAAPADLQALEHRLTRRFWVTYRKDGAALRVHFPKDLEPGDRNLLEMIALSTQLVRNGSGDPQWTALERDGAGMYLAAYQQSAAGQIVKRKLKYSETESGGPQNKGASLVLVMSEWRYTVDAQLQVTALEGGDHVRVGVPIGEGAWLDIRVSARFSDYQAGSAPELAGSLERERAEVESGPIATHRLEPAVSRAQRDKALLDGHSAAELLAAADIASSDTALPDRLAALFRQQPEDIAHALSVVRKRAGGLKLVTAALARAGTLAAVAGLGSLALDQSAAPIVRASALSAVVLMERPSVEAMRMPLALIDDAQPAVRGAARLALGSLARAGRDAHPAEALELDQALLARYAAASDAAHRIVLLSALGNSAGPTVLPVIEQAAADEDGDVRAASVRALRLGNEPWVDALLANVMTQDRDRSVRSAALFAAGFRRLGPLMHAVRKTAAEDPVDYLRRDAAALVRQYEGGASQSPPPR